MFLFSIFDKVWFVWIHCSNCILCEIVFSLRCIRTNTSKILFWLWIIKSIDFFDSMCSIRFMIKKFELKNVKIEFWSIYSFWFCCIQNNFTKSIDSNQFLKIFLQKAFAIVFVQKCYSYEINVINSNWLWFKIAISWLEIWNEIVRIQRNIIFQIDFFIAINHAKFLATTFDDNVNKIRREKFIDAIVYCLLSNSLYDLFENDQLIQLLNNSMIVFFLINFCKINIFVVETSFIQCILIDFLLILSNVNSLSFFWFEIVLHIYKFSIVCFYHNRHVIFDENILSCFCWNRRFINYWRCCSYFDFWYFAKKTKRSKSLFSRCFSMIWM